MGGQAGRARRGGRCGRGTHHLLTSSMTYSCSASHEPEHPTFAVEAAGEQHGARVDAVPAAALRRRRPGAARRPRRWRSRPSPGPRHPGRGPVAARRRTRSASTPRMVGTPERTGSPRILGCRAGNHPASWDGPACPPRPARSAHDHSQPTRPATIVTPEPIMHIAAGFMAAKHLFAASELGLFEALADSPAPLDGAGRAHRAHPPRRPDQRRRDGRTRPARARRRPLPQLAERGAVPRRGGPGRPAPVPAVLGPDQLPGLDRHSPGAGQRAADGDLRPGRRAAGDRLGRDRGDPGRPGAGPARGRRLRLAHRRLLDVGGGTGSWSIAVAERHPRPARHSRSTCPSVAAIADARVADAGLAGRIDVVAGDAMSWSTAARRPRRLPGGQPRALLRAGHEPRPAAPDPRAVAAPGARLLLADFWTDPTHTEPLARRVDGRGVRGARARRRRLQRRASARAGWPRPAGGSRRTCRWPARRA